MMEFNVYDWYSSPAIGATEKADYIIPAHEGSITQTCQGWKDGFEQIGCKWYVKSKYFEYCIYDRFHVICDKVILKGKGVD